jgi:hypothetical protein
VRDAGEDHLLLDVRDPVQFRVTSLPGAVSIPHNKLRARLDEVPRDKPGEELNHFSGSGPWLQLWVPSLSLPCNWCGILHGG